MRISGLLIAALISVLASCSSKKDQGSSTDSTGQNSDSLAQNLPSAPKLFIQDTPEAKYADSLYTRFLRDNPNYYKDHPMSGAFLRAEMISNQLVDLEKSPGVRVLQAVAIFNHGDIAVEISDTDSVFIDLYARILILEVKDRFVTLLADKDIAIAQNDPGMGRINNLSFVNYRVTPNNDAIGIVSQNRNTAYGLDERKNDLTMFIILENALTQVLNTTLKDTRKSFAPGPRYDPDNDYTKEVDLKVFGQTTLGLFDLLESTETTAPASNSVRTYRWSGARYE